MTLSSELFLFQRQQLVMTPALSQALYVLELPVEELEEWVSAEIEANPVLEVPERRFQGACSQEIFPLEERPESPGLYTQLWAQIRLLQLSSEEREIAERLIGSLDERGFLVENLSQLFPEALLEKVEAVRQQVLELEPWGVGSLGPREFLFLQLRQKGWAYEHFNLLEKGAYDEIAAMMGISLSRVKRVIASLKLSPVAQRCVGIAASITPDLIVRCDMGQWVVEVNQEGIPPISFHKGLDYRSLSSVERSYVAEHRKKGRWLQRACRERQRTLYKIGLALLKFQRAFFEMEGRGALVPLSMREVAQEIGMHESSVARAVRGKRMSSPRGITLLSDFFSQGEGMASRSVKSLLAMLVDKESKERPLSDLELLEELRKRGVSCARRTVAKYRGALGIPAAHKRRAHSLI